jgi:hypothetical protein
LAEAIETDSESEDELSDELENSDEDKEASPFGSKKTTFIFNFTETKQNLN